MDDVKGTYREPSNLSKDSDTRGAVAPWPNGALPKKSQPARPLIADISTTDHAFHPRQRIQKSPRRHEHRLGRVVTINPITPHPRAYDRRG